MATWMEIRTNGPSSLSPSLRPKPPRALQTNSITQLSVIKTSHQMPEWKGAGKYPWWDWRKEDGGFRSQKQDSEKRKRKNWHGNVATRRPRSETDGIERSVKVSKQGNTRTWSSIGQAGKSPKEPKASRSPNLRPAAPFKGITSQPISRDRTPRGFLKRERAVVYQRMKIIGNQIFTSLYAGTPSWAYTQCLAAQKVERFWLE